MRRIGLILTAAILTLGATSGPTHAQCSDQSRRQAQADLDLTDTRIEQADALISGTDIRPAHDELGLAVQIQQRARGEFAQDHCRAASDLTRMARDHVARAIALVRGMPGSLPDRARVQLDRTGEIIERARDQIEDCERDRARALLKAALAMQSRAEDAFQTDRFLAALQLTVSARERALRALRLCRVQENLQESAERALRRTDNVLARVHDRLADADRLPERMRRLLDHAVDLQSRARAEFRAEHFEPSLRMTQSARAMAYRVLRIVGRI